MARQPDIQYMRVYTDGSAARKLEPQPQKKNKVALPQPKVRKERRKVIHLDPLSLCAMAAAGFMLIAMAVGMIHLGNTNAQAQRMESYVSQLQSENAQLRETYQSGYDLAEVEQRARELGLIPIEKAAHKEIDVQVPQPDPEPTFWENIGIFLKELFA